MEVSEARAHYGLTESQSDSVPAGYKQTEVGLIPEDWVVEPLASLMKFKNGLNKGKQFFGYGTPIVNYMDVYNHSALRAVDIHGRVYVTSQELDAFSVRRGDVFFTRTSETVEEIGVACVLLDESPRTVFSGFVLRGRPKNDVLVDTFKQYCFSSSIFRDQVVSKSTYTTRALTSGRVLSSIGLPLPPNKAEQEAIAKALSDVDALIESLEQLIAKMRQIKKGTMQALLTGKQRLPGFDGRFVRKTLASLFDFSGGYSASREQLSVEGHCYLHYGDIHTSSKSFVDVSSERQDLPKLDIPLNKVNASSLLEDGDVVFVDASEDDDGTSKHVVIVNADHIPFISGLHTIVAKSKSAELAHSFRRFCFQTADIRRQFRFFAVGTKVLGVSKSNIGKIELLVPPVDEQVAIAALLTDMDTELAELEARLAKTRQLKQGMMQELLTGGIRLV